MRPGPATRVLCLALGLLSLPGCGLITLLHDKMLGPISPAGRIHPFVTGTNVRVGRRGPEASAIQGTADFRPYPLDILRHAYRTPVVLLYGMQFYLGFVLRFVLQRDEQVGMPPPEAGRTALREEGIAGWDVERVLRELGCPQVWIKRREGSVMLYASQVSHELGVSIGVPPGVGSLIPIPGVGELLRFDYNDTDVVRERTLLVFDAQGQLIAAQERRPDPEPVVEEGE